jgi:hypothetical protein
LSFSIQTKNARHYHYRLTQAKQRSSDHSVQLTNFQYNHRKHYRQ